MQQKIENLFFMKFRKCEFIFVFQRCGHIGPSANFMFKNKISLKSHFTKETGERERERERERKKE